MAGLIEKAYEKNPLAKLPGKNGDDARAALNLEIQQIQKLMGGGDAAPTSTQRTIDFSKIG